MIYIYNDYGGTHTTSLAAAIHLQILKPPFTSLSKEEILAVPYFNKLSKKDFGTFIFHGKDAEGNSVYTLARKSQNLVIPSLLNFGILLLKHFKVEERIIFSNTSPTVPFSMSLGGFLAKGLKLNRIGVPLLVMGAQKCVNHIHELVENTKRTALTPTHEKIIVLENKQYKI
ncbi:ABC transporter [Bacillus obstructivus]|uniref:DUF3189 family protein n=1 Tax=Heyndrickxia oleronia TaxID=38875 RepID=UPI00071741D5|nr:DUF3189 family protein [Heyndrickxia oleronia]MBU5213262.1 DUF3189 family protein [Heyndrickxia oleronia]OJH19631.1 ABC transporter [Bacillus obstructivus]